MNVILISVLLTVLTFVNILMPISGSPIVTPLLALMTEPHRAIGLTAIYFLMSGIIRSYLFRKHIIWQEVRTLAIPSFIGAGLGALTTGIIPARWLFLAILISTAYFLYTKVRNVHKELEIHILPFWTGLGVGSFSGYLQGVGLSGSDIRGAYLWATGMKHENVHGTGATLGLITFGTVTLFRLGSNQLVPGDVLFMLPFFPLILIATLIGRGILFKTPEKMRQVVIISLLSLSLILLLQKTWAMFFV